MPKDESHTPAFDCRLTSFEGSGREQLRRSAQLPLENILLSSEEMQDLAYLFSTAPVANADESARVKEAWRTIGGNAAE